MNLQHPSPFRAPRHRFTALHGLLLASSAFLLTACPQAAPPPSEPSPTPASTPVAIPAAPTATPTPTITQKYSGEQQMQYMAAARDGFIADRQQKSQAFLDAFKELEAAGGNSPKGLTSKDAITARRALIAKCLAGNDEYIDFVRTQEDTYRAELSKTPLVPAEVDGIVKDFSQKANTPVIVKLREDQRDALKCSDDMMAVLEKSFGDWSVNDAGRLTFKKKGDVAAFSALSEKYNKLVAEQEAMRKTISGATAPVPSDSVAPSPIPAGAASPGAAANPAAATPAAKP